LKIVGTVGVAPLRPPTFGMRNTYPRLCPNPLRFLVFYFQTATSLFRTRNFGTLHFQQNFSTANASKDRISTERSGTSASCWWYNAWIRYKVSFPHLSTVNQLPVSDTIMFYDPQIPLHSLNARHN